MKLEFTIIYKESDGAYHAYIPEVPGVISSGATIDLAREYVLDALSLVLEHRRDEAKADPSVVTSEKLVLTATVVTETAA